LFIFLLAHGIPPILTAQPESKLRNTGSLHKNNSTLVIPKPALSAGNLLCCNSEAADSSRDNAAASE
jgi:hypothetical protein